MWSDYVQIVGGLRDCDAVSFRLLGPTDLVGHSSTEQGQLVSKQVHSAADLAYALCNIVPRTVAAVPLVELFE